MELKLSIFLSLAVILAGTVSAKSVDETTAHTVAARFYAMKFNHTPESLTPTIAYTASALRGENVPAPSFYVFNFNSEGFVIVAGDDRVQPILAFSDEGAFVAENMPDHIRFFLDGYTEEIQYIADHQQYTNETTQQQWEQLLSDNSPIQKDGNVVVGPLLGNNKWNQTKYSNDLCPADASGNNAYGGHVAVGCGALVMGQVMRYWQYPTTGRGSHSYNSSNYGSLSANFGATTYHYESMPDLLGVGHHADSCVEAISTLLYHCGVAVNMNYGPSASVCNSNKIVAALSTYFRYPTTVQYIERGSSSSTTWLNYLKGELDEGAPFMYGGSGSYGGHVWTCDGYRDDDYFHFNWGWGGQQNGYFLITNCSSYGFNSNHAIIIGIRGPELPGDISENSVENINVFPNPTNGNVYVCTESQPVHEVQIFDLSGRMLIQKSVAEKEFSIDLSNYTTGTYILRLFTTDGIDTRKIVIN